MRHNKTRFLYMILTGVLLTFGMKYTVFTMPQNHTILYDFLTTIIITGLVWEGNLRIDEWFNKKLPWVTKTFQRIVFQFIVAMFFSAIIIFIIIIVYQKYVYCQTWENKSVLSSSFFTGLIVSFVLIGIEVSMQFFKNWKASLIEIEKYKTESIQAQLQNLKEQVNPHFLFNNLSVLSSLVYKNQDKAVDFINQLAKVYRYLLDNRNNELVTLEEELVFLNSYIYLLSIRFEDSLHFELNINDSLKQKLMPPMCLQMLVENAIKHNEVSSAFPLTISIISEEEKIIVSNKIQPRNYVENSSKTGLKNILSRYSFFTTEKVIINNQAQQFSVSLPLISNA